MAYLTSEGALRKRCQTLRSTSVKRCAAIYDKSGRLTRAAIAIVWDVDGLIAWMRQQQVGQDVWACAYCNRRMVLSEVELDHIDPLAAGGGGGLDNLTPACKLCNQTKGELSGVHYLRLLEVLRTMPFAAESYVLTALRMVGLAKRQRFFPRKAAPASASRPPTY